ncbi:MAG: type VI secretion system Vgr family protein [Planctomycetota bacterium]|jgi:type VI secretion system secreted protein VgrG
MGLEQNDNTTATANEPTFLFNLNDSEPGDWLVTGFDGTEGFSELFDYRVQLSTELTDVDTSQLVGKAARLEIIGEHGSRFVHGIIRRMELVEDNGKANFYDANLVPPHWLLTKRINSRIFQKPRYAQMTIPNIVSHVISESGLPNDSLCFALMDEYEEREFVVQYRESDWDFISRLMEEEGIYYHFEHDLGRCVLNVVDSKDFHMPYIGDEGGAAIPYKDPNGLVPEEEFVYRVHCASEIQVGSVTLDDYTFKNPGQELRATATGDRFTELSHVDYPGSYEKTKVGLSLAAKQLEHHRSAAEVSTFSTTVRQLQPGTTFDLTGHPSDRYNQTYLVTRVTHRALQTQSSEGQGGGGLGTRYESTVRVIPAQTQYRPPHVTPKPTVRGSQTAIVVGPASEEIHTDEFGRIKVRFHWDQGAGYDENASCWIRVSQGAAGGQYGMMFLPRIGQEVIVDFLEGDPDKPIVTGRVYNNDHMPPYKLPQEKAISTIKTCSTPGAAGSNEIRFDDSKDKEELLLNAQKEMHLRACASRIESTGGSLHSRVGKDAFEFIKERKQSIVGLDKIEEVRGTLHQHVEGDVKEFYSGKQTRYVDKQYNLLNGKGIWMGSDGGITFWCKGNFIRLDETGVTIVGKQVKINSGGSTSIPSPDAPDYPEEPRSASKNETGRNTNYNVTPQGQEQVNPDQMELAAEAEPVLAEKNSWIEIELVDDLSRPCPNEEYEVTEPNGEVTRGTLDANGMARVLVQDPGTCQVSFPKLDQAKWEKN